MEAKEGTGPKTKDPPELRFLNIISNSADGILIVDEGGIIRFVNPASEKIFCRKADALIGEEFGFPVLAGDKTEIEILCGPDQKTTVEMRVTQIAWDGRVAYLAALRDISERKLAEQRMKQLMKELTRSNKELEQFAYAVSHDLQAPLRSVSSFTQLLTKQYKGKLDQKADNYLEIIGKGAKRMQGMIEDILTYSKVGTKTVDAKPFRLESSLAKAIDNLLISIKESGTIITNDPLPSVRADQTQMTLLFQNLLENAIKFCDNSPRIHVSAEKKKGEWICSVRDNGIGIDPKQIDRLFAVFQRLHTAEEYAGTGIGLAICKKIVERQGGHIWVESEPGKGATFFFSVPSHTSG